MDSPTLSNNARLLENFVNIPHRLLGRTLRPFCLLHYLWLQYVASPFVFTAKAVSLQDLELASLICSSGTSEEILAGLAALGKNAGRWERTKAGFRRWRYRHTDVKAETRAFLAYQDDYCSLPEFAEQGGESNEVFPFCLMQAVVLMRETGWDEKTVLTMPLGKVVWYNAAFGYLRTGETSVVSDKERLAMDALRQLTGAAG